MITTKKKNKKIDNFSKRPFNKEGWGNDSVRHLYVVTKGSAIKLTEPEPN